jgi:hypothetical protein
MQRNNSAASLKRDREIDKLMFSRSPDPPSPATQKKSNSSIVSPNSIETSTASPKSTDAALCEVNEEEKKKLKINNTPYSSVEILSGIGLHLLSSTPFSKIFKNEFGVYKMATKISSINGSETLSADETIIVNLKSHISFACNDFNGLHMVVGTDEFQTFHAAVKSHMTSIIQGNIPETLLQVSLRFDIVVFFEITPSVPTSIFI